MDSIEEIDFDLRDEPLIEKYILLIEKEVRAEFKQRLVKIYKGEQNWLNFFNIYFTMFNLEKNHYFFLIDSSCD